MVESRALEPPRAAWAIGPVVLSIVQVVGSIGAAHGQPDRRPLDAAAFALLLAGPLSLLPLRRWPRAVAAWVAGVTTGYLAAGYPYGPVFASVAVVLVVSVVRGDRVVAWLVAATVLLGEVLSTLVLRPGSWSWAGAAGMLAWALVLLAVAEAVKGRRDRALSQRDARREADRRRAGEERLRIAQELHDVVAHHMSLINVQAGVALHLLEKHPEQVEPALSAIKGASGEALSEMRSLVGVLRTEGEPAPRSPVATLDALEELVARSAQAGLAVTTHTTGEPRPLPAAVDLAAFRVVQESVTNVVRHAGARHVDIALDYGADVLTVRVEDDGRGAAPDGPQPGNGISGMRERTTALGGNLAVGTSPLGGLLVEARLPLGGRA
jgi:signal transduction histidine kinase